MTHAFELAQKVSELLKKEHKMKVLDNRGRITLGSEYRGHYLYYKTIKIKEGVYLLIGIIKSPEEIAKDIIKDLIQ